MSRFLRHFTAVGDEQNTATQGHDEEPHDASEDLELATGQHLGQVSFRDSLRRLYSTERFQIITESLRRMFLPLFQVFHYLSLTLLTFFMVELSGKIYAYRLEFLHHKFEVFDGIVVVVSFILDIVYISKEDAFDAMGLLILLRLWRVARIINGIIMSVKNRAHHKVQKIKEINENLVHQVNELKERNTKMDQENARLRAILKQHCIEF
ncbi:voltage-gated hydrogen channel 1 isoform X2 [Sinocyclocheilus rhinocerous]|uniref:voltage-gated hydrogen channel 1 isoform X2 n=1 Tax=Sinocyclocheilus rhinocerous TaxID=307959 RepID=UPI0007B8D56C|nr:PREDICTED: voltage-gated hydrogen channel 1-like isoform X2 [Sinocyclocheilus rhinocerous]